MINSTNIIKDGIRGSSPVAKVRILSPKAVLPERTTPGSAGYDLSSVSELTVIPSGFAKIPTGIAVSIPNGCYGRIAPRSSLSVKRVMVNGGVIDEDYRGEIYVILYNLGESPFQVKAGDRIAQLIFERIFHPEMVVVDELDRSDRGDAGFGSTGIRK